MDEEKKTEEEEVNKSGTEEKETPNPNADYEEQLKNLREEKQLSDEKAENLSKALEEERQKKKKKEPEEEERVEKKSEIDVDSLKEEILSNVDQKLNQSQMDMVSVTFDEEINDLSGNEKERELIREHYQRSIRPSGLTREAIRKDLLLCKAAANLSRLSLDDGTGQTRKFTTALAGGGSKPKGMESDPDEKLSEDDQDFKSKMSKVAKAYTP